MPTLYIKDTSYGFGVYRRGVLIQEFVTRKEAQNFIDGKGDEEDG